MKLRVHGTGVNSDPREEVSDVHHDDPPRRAAYARHEFGDFVLAGVIVYAFLKAQRERAGQVSAPADNPPLEPSAGR